MRLGFSGTREGMSQHQYDAVETFIIENVLTEAHHGDCVGADETFDKLVRYHNPELTVDIHPPLKGRYRAWCQAVGSRLHPAKDYYARNRDIVLACDWLIACPLSDEEVGGTWYTVNWARELRDQGHPAPRILIVRRDWQKELVPE